MKNSSRGVMLNLLVVALLLVSVISLSAFGASKAIPQRADIEDKYKWNLKDIYPSEEAWEADYKFLDENMERMAQFQGKLGESSDMLLKCFQLRDSLYLIENNLWVYSYLNLDEDNRESKYQELTQRIQGLSSRMSTFMSYIDPELLTIPNDKLLGFLNTNIELGVYRFSLENLIRQKEHILSDKEERILSLASPVVSSPSQIFSMIDEADMDYGTIVDDDGEEIQLTKERYYSLMETASRTGNIQGKLKLMALGLIFSAYTYSLQGDQERFKKTCNTARKDAAKEFATCLGSCAGKLAVKTANTNAQDIYNSLHKLGSWIGLSSSTTHASQSR